ncbi:hypothetical protein [Nocardia sp. NPDC006630]|uniref:hypothetical protein n=1 Tax=Nocardia sp. NPDC006630 TaxID=3157181 RepID=UPI0033BDFF27
MEDAESLIAEWESRVDVSWVAFWDQLSPIWRQVLSGSTSGVAPAAGPILRRRRLTTDLAWVGYFEPVKCLPAVREALLWDENSMDLGPLTLTLEGHTRSWDQLLLGGPARVDLGQLRGTPIRHLVLSVVDVEQVDALGEIPGLESLTLDLYGDSITLPTLSTLTELKLYSDTDIDSAGTRANPALQITRIASPYWPPPFGPNDIN